ncbi:MAG: UTP--glucose-1-phosphate uridylyltransferase [Clostridia bacterium]|nr:UTP--glucose-1-phosphate uridylyltransferase [Clostridia bacterium]
MKKVRKAIIPAAGLGTRMLPIARCIPKEMLPIVDRPAVSYLVEEAAKSGITDILIITGRDKEAMEDYFDYSPEYDSVLEGKGRSDEVADMHNAAYGANVYFVRQKERHGLGHAVSLARNFIGDEPFCILYGDDIVFAETPVCAQMIESYEKYGRPVVGVKSVPDELVMKYCSLKAEAIEGSDREYFVDDMIEKPKKEQIYSNLAILGRVLLTPEIFDILDRTPVGAGGELQLTDAMAEYARRHGVTALDFEGTRYDMGSKIGFMQANVTEGLKNSEIGPALREFIKSIAATL